MSEHGWTSRAAEPTITGSEVRALSARFARTGFGGVDGPPPDGSVPGQALDEATAQQTELDAENLRAAIASPRPSIVRRVLPTIHLRREARFGLAAILSFVILAGVFFMNRGKSGKPTPPLKIVQNQKAPAATLPARSDSSPEPVDQPKPGEQAAPPAPLPTESIVFPTADESTPDSDLPLPRRDQKLLAAADTVPPAPASPPEPEKKPKEAEPAPQPKPAEAAPENPTPTAPVAAPAETIPAPAPPPATKESDPKPGPPAEAKPAVPAPMPTPAAAAMPEPAPSSTKASDSTPMTPPTTTAPLVTESSIPLPTPLPAPQPRPMPTPPPAAPAPEPKNPDPKGTEKNPIGAPSPPVAPSERRNPEAEKNPGSPSPVAPVEAVAPPSETASSSPPEQPKPQSETPRQPIPAPARSQEPDASISIPSAPEKANPAPPPRELENPIRSTPTIPEPTAVEPKTPTEAASEGEWVVIPNVRLRREVDDGFKERAVPQTTPVDRSDLEGPVERDKDEVEAVPHVVQSKENFWTISRLYYGSGRYWRALWAANRQKVAAPEKLVVGTMIRIPPIEALDRSLIEPLKTTRNAPPAAPQIPLHRTSRPVLNGDQPESNPADGENEELILPVDESITRRKAVPEAIDDLDPGPETKRYRPRRPVYKVRRYDTLRSIAREKLGDSHRAGEILELNADVVDDERHLIPGQVLELPEDAASGR